MVATVQARIYAALLASFCVLGLCITFAQPIFSSPDEPLHWMTANVRVERLFGGRGCVPTVHNYPCPRDQICSALPKLRLDCIGDVGVYGDALTYPGVLLSKLILPHQTESAVRQVQGFLLSRLLQGLFVLLCLVRVGVLTQQNGRFGSLTLGAFALSPLFAQQAFAVSSDGAQLAFGACLFAIVMFWDALTWLDALAFLLFGYASTAKPTVLPLVIPAALAGYWLSQLEQAEGRGFAAMVRDLWRLLKPTNRPSPQTLILWSALLLSLLTVVFSLAHDARGQAESSAEDNLGRIAHLAELRAHPLSAFGLPARTRIRLGDMRFWVGPLGWLDARVSAAVVHSFGRILALCAGFELCLIGWLAYRNRSASGLARRFAFSLPALSLGLLAVFANIVFVSAIMYVLWTPEDSKWVEGVQIRYFFPAVMLLLALCFRIVTGLVPSLRENLPALPSRARWLNIAAPCLVFALSLPFVTRLYVDLSLRYHNPAKYQQP